MPAGAGLSYVLPLRWDRAFREEDLTDYLAWLSDRAEVIVVDGSDDPEVFAAHAAAWGSHVTHVPVVPALRTLQGKVGGVLTGVRLATADVVVIADDDVRWDEGGLRHALGLMEQAELVFPQNYFDPLPWHACWDSGRTLLNRMIGGDYPGTVVVRRLALLAVGGYEGSALFENLELRRTVEAAGGRVVVPLDLYVRRLPPSSRHFWSQRVRQAYDEFARPARLGLSLALVPGAIRLGRRRWWGRLLAVGCGTAALAEAGRRRAGGAAYWPPSTSLMAPVWLVERAVCAWVAVGQRLLLGGTPYRGTVLRDAATSPRALRARVRQRASGLAVDRDVLLAVAGEGALGPVAPAVLQPQAGQPGHEVELRGPRVPMVGGEETDTVG